MARISTIKLYDGPSVLDLCPIIVLLTGLAKASTNTKTGDMLQTWIMRKDVPPNEAIKTGQDVSVCGGCQLRPFKNSSGKPCYVKVWQAPLSTWKANKDLPVTSHEVARALVAGRVLRRGSYSDPAAVPQEVWDNLRASPGTGYSHQWEAFPHFAPYVMASVHTEEERSRARALGYRTFRVISDVSEVSRGEVLCPASKEAGARVQCARCNLCNGSKARVLTCPDTRTQEEKANRADDEYLYGGWAQAMQRERAGVDWTKDKRKDIVIVAH